MAYMLYSSVCAEHSTTRTLGYWALINRAALIPSIFLHRNIHYHHGGLKLSHIRYSLVTIAALIRTIAEFLSRPGWAAVPHEYCSLRDRSLH